MTEVEKIRRIYVPYMISKIVIKQENERKGTYGIPSLHMRLSSSLDPTLIPFSLARERQPSSASVRFMA